VPEERDCERLIGGVEPNGYVLPVSLGVDAQDSVVVRIEVPLGHEPARDVLREDRVLRQVRLASAGQCGVRQVE
jgi:hypothetical protein